MPFVFKEADDIVFTVGLLPHRILLVPATPTDPILRRRFLLVLVTLDLCFSDLSESRSACFSFLECGEVASV
ncbi:hypothetical protein DY000_02042053 [Brassica cretica]|uniref:Uncharacterized protein n=1 Tax=Brassica cretica TaxID=69181 RepID=A0ABQ7B725_BRACR|nr:hypothetical protein DY000_02042053 [Brassica cretica]